MLISEIYHSRQGEGLLTGTPSLFLRTSGCNLRCGFCDTPFASWDPEGQSMTVEQIVQQSETLARAESIEHVVITGGEPMIQKEMVTLSRDLKELGLHITMETAGTVYMPVKTDLMSISPKLSNSTPDEDRAGAWVQRHERTRHQPDTVQRLVNEYPYQLKFVVDTREDLHEIEQYLGLLESFQPDRVLLMPQGVTQEELATKGWLEEESQNRGFRFSPRMHIQWYGNRRGT